MSVLKKIKEVTEDMERLAKEKPQVTITSDSVMLVENYKSIKMFTEDKLLLDLEDFYMYVCGSKLVIKFFSPSRLIVCGAIRSISYVEDSMSISEEL